ncbi:MAG: wax ester/triacylglycerol synthase family O-acyltransferase [Chloroflexi bacterium]|nr:MAG: wax ester/triacylglycerol synthase family O-acyltransferase [Chloroflexota bacterium]
MGQRHLDRLSVVDATFLHQERHGSHMHIGGIAIFDGPPPPLEEVLGHIGGRLPMVPRYRQKLAFPPFEAGRPLWIDDPNFTLEYHVRQTALPSPGAEEQLLRLAARIASQRLDRGKPLWELWIVEGLEGNRFAVISKTHHALVDGVSGAELMTLLFDLAPEPAPRVEPDAPWQAEPEPGTAGLLAAGVRDAARTAVELAETAVSAAGRPLTVAGKAAESAQALAEITWAALNPPTRTPLNGPIGPHRRFVAVRGDLAEFRLIKNTFGGTINDVVVSVVSGGIARWLHKRGVRTEGLHLRACVPMSVRGLDERTAMGNKIVIMLAPLPVYVEDPIERLRVVRAAMDGVKESKQALGARVITDMQDFAPPTLLAQASRLAFSTRFYNVLVTNVPGPQFPVYMLGRELREVFPIAFLAEDKRLAVAIMSYNGRIGFGLIGDYDEMHDIDVVARGIATAIDELVRLARSQSAEEVRAAEPVAVAKPPANGAGASARSRGRRGDSKTSRRTAARAAAPRRRGGGGRRGRAEPRGAEPPTA